MPNATIPEIDARIALLLATKLTIMVFGLVGNLLVIAVIVSSRQLHTRVNALMVNLAMADTLSLAVCVPHGILVDFRTAYKPHIVCKLSFWLEHVFTMASSLCIVLVAVERFIVVWYPLKAPVLLAKRGLRTGSLVLLWCLSLTVPLPFFFTAFLSSALDAETGVTLYSCSVPMSNQTLLPFVMTHGTFYVVNTATELFLPLGLTAVLYALVFCRLLCSFRHLRGKHGEQADSRRTSGARLSVPSRQSGRSCGAPEQQERSRRSHQACCTTNSGALKHRRRVVYFSVIVAAVYFFTTMPFRSLALCLANDACFYSISGFLSPLMVDLLRVLFYLNYCLNPVIYNLACRNFRVEFRRFLSCCLAGGGQPDGGRTAAAAAAATSRLLTQSGRREAAGEPSCAMETARLAGRRNLAKDDRVATPID